MRLYENKIINFIEDVNHNRIADIIEDRFISYYGRQVAASEKNSWVNSLNFLKNAIEISKINDTYIVVEYELPYCSRRIDVLLFGYNSDKKENVLIIELKQWSNGQIRHVDSDGNLEVKYQNGWVEQAHPSIQAEGYYYGIKDFNTYFEDNNIVLKASVYCHNYTKNEQSVIFDNKFTDWLEEFPVYTKDDVNLLGEHLKNHLDGGKGDIIFERFVNSPIKPSKLLLDHTRDMINDQQIFTLIDDQISAYNAIMSKAKKLSNSNEKSVIIVKGGPGTGKSVIALEVMGELMRNGQLVFHATGSSAFTNTLRKILGTRLRGLFKFFNSFMSIKASIDVLICDEAHRIRENSTSRYTPKHQRTNVPQINELLSVSKLSIYFIDEFQIVRPNEIGSSKLIMDAAKSLGIKDENIKTFDLKTQFRCSGSDSYLRWLDNTLMIRNTDKEMLTEEDRMDFQIIDDPVDLKLIIDEKNAEKKNSARLVAGFCWPWSAPNPDGSLVEDVVIDGLAMPWENKKQFWKWATDDSGMEQVGTVYTAQGFEFDYIGILFSDDLIYDWNINQWKAVPEKSYDLAAKRGNSNFDKHLKNVYRVLMSRAHKGCYVYFKNKDTEEYFRSKIKLYTDID